MASDNETVADAIAAVRKAIHECPAIKGGIGEYRYQLKANGAIDRIEAAHQREVAELQRRLKVAEDALEFAWMYASKLPHQWPLPERVRAKMKNSLAAIREGGAK